jgi:hypothetical protein
MTMVRFAITASAATLVACGARTDIGNGGRGDAGVVDAVVDAPADVTPDSPPPLGPCSVSGITTLASHQSPRDIQLDALHVYWLNDNPSGVRRMQKSGGAVEDVTALPGEVGWSLAIDDAFVYAGGGGAVWRAPKNGGPATQLAAAELAYGLAVDETTLSFTMTGAGVWSVPKTGGPALALTSPVGEAMHLAAGYDGYVYYTWWGGQGGMGRVPTAGGSPELLGQGPDANYVVTDADNVYWDDQHSIWKVPKAGGMQIQLAGSGNNPQGLAFDDTFVYWADFSSVWKVAKTSGGLAIFADSQDNVRTVAVDETCVYWTLDPTIGEIRAAPR